MTVTETTLFRENTMELGRPVQNWVDSPLVVEVIGRNEFVSANNRWPAKRRKKQIASDTGSNWTMYKTQIDMSPFRLNALCHLGGDVYTGYRGPVLVGHDNYVMSSEDWLELPLGSTAEEGLTALGTTAIARVLPTNPISDLPTAVGELLTEGLPNLPGKATFINRGISRQQLAGEYLGYEFGIKPFLSDLGKFTKSVQEAEKLIAQYVKKAGVPIRRGYDFPVHDETTTIVYPVETGNESRLGGPRQSQIAHAFYASLGGWPGELTEIRNQYKRTWFRGAFTYYLPPVGDEWSNKLLRQEAELRYLYGGLSVDTAWNLLPYSWAADWFTNAGDLIHNLAAFARDGLVMGWGYIMEHCELHVTSILRDCYVGHCRIWNDVDLGSNNNPHVLPELTTSYHVVSKRRRKATPFGFGLDVDGFTGRQKAITLALFNR